MIKLKVTFKEEGMSRARNKLSVSVFIDASGMTEDGVSVVMNKANSFGGVSTKRMYGDWSKQSLTPLGGAIDQYALQAIQPLSPATAGDTAGSLVAITIGVMDAIKGRKTDVICLTSSSGALTPLAIHCISKGKRVLGFGDESTPRHFVAACSSFTYLETPEPPEVKTPAPPELFDPLGGLDIVEQTITPKPTLSRFYFKKAMKILESSATSRKRGKKEQQQ